MRPHSLQFLANFAVSNSLLFIPVLIVEELGGNEIDVGLVTALYSLSAFFSAYYFGRIADQHGRRVILSIGFGASAIAFLMQVFCSSLVTLALVRVLCGLSIGIYPGALIAYAYETRYRLGKFSSFGSLGWGAGTLLAGALALYYQIFVASSLLFLIAFIFSFRLPSHEEKKMKVPFFPRRIIKNNLPEYLSVLLRHTGASGIWTIFPLFLMDLGATPFYIGLIYLTNMLTQFVVMQSIDSFPGERLLMGGLGLSIIAFLSFTQAPNLWWMFPTQVVLGAAWALLYVGALKCIVHKNVERATSSGLLTSTISISGIIGPLWGGAVAYALGYEWTMYIASVLTVISVIYLYSNR